MRLLLLLLLSVLPCFGQLTNLTFVWDGPLSATGYRFYEVQSNSNRVILGSTILPTFIVTNWNVSTSRTVTVTATNILGESTIAPPLTVPPAPAPVQNLKPIPLSIVTTVPGVLELSQDLVDWTERIRVSSGSNSTVMVTWIQYPKEPLLFMRSWSQIPKNLPPFP